MNFKRTPNDPLPGLLVQRQCVSILEPHFLSDISEETFITKTLRHASTYFHIMDFTNLRALTSMMSLLNEGIMNIVNYNGLHSDFPLSDDIVSKYLNNRIIFSIMWGFGGSINLSDREKFSNKLRETDKQKRSSPVSR